MHSSLTRRTWVTILSLSLAFTAGLKYSRAEQPQQQQNQQVASVEQLETEAFQALRDGQFAKTNQLLARAADLSTDPTVRKMALWTSSFEQQRQSFSAERHKQYEKTVGEVQLLIKNNYHDYALDSARNAYVLADDKKAFRNEKWVGQLITDAVARAHEYEQKEQWLRLLRIYSDLSNIEPANPDWKDKLKVVTRRIRLLALYTPSELKALQEVETKNHQGAEKLLAPATQTASDSDTAATKKTATTGPVDQDDEKLDTFQLDWHEQLKDIEPRMLWEALMDAQVNYFRDINYRTLALGGLKGLSAVATTRGLEKSFPKLADEHQRSRFLAGIQAATEKANAPTPNGKMMLREVLDDMQIANKSTVELPEEVLVSEFADGAFGELDPFSNMIWPSEVAEFNKQTQGEFSGVGIQIQTDEADGSLKVVSPLEDSPAYKAGIKAGDTITHIDGKSARHISLTQAVKTITGPKGTTVRLTVRSPDRSVKDYSLVRDTIKVDSIKGWLHRPGGGWEYFIDPDNKVAYLRLTNFTKNTGDELRRAEDELQQAGAKALILDLRYNPGGLLTAAVDVSDRFLTDGGPYHGMIVSTHPDRDTPNKPTENEAKTDGDEITLPMVVLVNQYSASASEIVSGALKDQKRALIVGERTFGKGSVQMLFPLADHAAYLKLTTSHYYLPSGRCIHREENSTDWGVDPDVTVEMTPEQMRAAIDARTDMDVLRDATPPTPGKAEQPPLKEKADAVKDAVEQKRNEEKAKKNKDPLACDPQLNAALLLLRLQLSGAHVYPVLAWTK